MPAAKKKTPTFPQSNNQEISGKCPYKKSCGVLAKITQNEWKLLFEPSQPQHLPRPLKHRCRPSHRPLTYRRKNPTLTDVAATNREASMSRSKAYPRGRTPLKLLKSGSATSTIVGANRHTTMHPNLHSIIASPLTVFDVFFLHKHLAL